MRLISHVRLFMMISHVKIIAFQTITNHSFWTFYIGGKPVVYNNKQKNTWVLGITRFISLRLLMRYHVQHSKYIWYFRAPMYYSLYHWCELDQQKIKSKTVFYFIWLITVIYTIVTGFVNLKLNTE